MKPYLLFAGMNYYPSGGMGDFQGDFDSVDEAIDFFHKRNEGSKNWGWEWYSVVQHSDLNEVDSWESLG